MFVKFRDNMRYTNWNLKNMCILLYKGSGDDISILISLVHEYTDL